MQMMNGVQMNTKLGMSFNQTYNVPDTGLTNNTTLANNPLYNLLQIVFQNKQTDNIGQQLAKAADVNTRGDGVGLTNFQGDSNIKQWVG